MKKINKFISLHLLVDQKIVSKISIFINRYTTYNVNFVEIIPRNLILKNYLINLNIKYYLKILKENTSKTVL